jgi:tetratricopeptide (TPR) repeat protein
MAAEYWRRGDRARAESWYRQARTLAPGWYVPWLEEARMLYVAGAGAAGAALLDRACEEMPQTLELQLAAARFFLDEAPEDQVDYARGLRAAQRAKELTEEKNAAVLEFVSRAEAGLNHRDEAIQAMRQAIALESTEARLELLKTLEAMPAP